MGLVVAHGDDSSGGVSGGEMASAFPRPRRELKPNGLYVLKQRSREIKGQGGPK